MVNVQGRKTLLPSCKANRYGHENRREGQDVDRAAIAEGKVAQKVGDEMRPFSRTDRQRLNQ